VLSARPVTSYEVMFDAQGRRTVPFANASAAVFMLFEVDLITVYSRPAGEVALSSAAPHDIVKPEALTLLNAIAEPVPILGGVVSEVELLLPDDEEHPVTAANAMINDRVINVLKNRLAMIVSPKIIDVTGLIIGYFPDIIRINIQHLYYYS
jgi:hypothetical protein